jgi:hypothetical protein
VPATQLNDLPPPDVVNDDDNDSGSNRDAGNDDDDDGSGDGDGEPIRWVTVAAFASDPLDAHLASIRLASRNIPCFVADEHIAGSAWHYALATGVTKVKVPLEHAAAAVAVLGEGPGVEGVDCDQAASRPRLAAACPLCGCGDFRDCRWTFRRLVRLALVWILSLGVSPIVAMILPVIGIISMARSPRRRCNECGCEFDGQDPRRGFEVLTASPAAADDAAAPRA